MLYRIGDDLAPEVSAPEILLPLTISYIPTEIMIDRPQKRCQHFQLSLTRELGLSPRESFRRSSHFSIYFTHRLDVEHVLEGHTGCVNRLAWNEDGSRLASGSDDRKASPWHGRLGACIMVHWGGKITKPLPVISKESNLQQGYPTVHAYSKVHTYILYIH